jgi:hypothetical protein
MANIPIPNLPLAITLDGTEQLAAVQYGTSVRVTTGQIASLGGGGGGVTSIIAGPGITIDQSTGDVTVETTNDNSPGGEFPQMQYNDSGVFGGATMTFDPFIGNYVIPPFANPSVTGLPMLSVSATQPDDANTVNGVEVIGISQNSGESSANLDAFIIKPWPEANDYHTYIIGHSPELFRITRGHTDNILSYSEASSQIEIGNSGANVFFPGYAINVTARPLSEILISGSQAGARATVSDSSIPMTGNFGVIVSDGGSFIVPVFFDGTNWLIG